MDTRSARSRGAAAIVASLALLGSGAALTGTPAQSASAADPACTAYPVDDLEPNQPVTGLTVTEGTTPQGFQGRYLGVGGQIGSSVPMLMFELTDAPPLGSGKIDEVGIWAGMSGSPVYAADGRLIGAVAYGLAYGDEPVAGVTPYEAMDDYMATAAAEPARRVAISDSAARVLVRETDVTSGEATGNFRQLPMNMTYSGITAKRLNKVMNKGPDYINTRGIRAGGAASSETSAGPEDLVPGGNLGAAASYGTITLGGVGTVTSVCDGRLIGFGHPMTWGGETSLGMMPAEAIRVMKDPFVSFKLANLAEEPAGTIDQDRLTGISGPLGALPDQTSITSTVTYGTRTKEGNSHSLVSDYHADVTFVQTLAMHDEAIDAVPVPGSEDSTVRITGTSGGDEFILETGDRYVSDWDIAFEGVWSIADLVYILSRIDGVQLTSVDTGATVTDSTDTLRVGKLQQKRGGKWVTLTRRQPAVVRPGGLLTVKVQLNGPDGADSLVQNVRVSRKARGEGRLSVTGGAWTWSDDLYDATTVAEVQQALEADVRNDEVETRLDFWSRRAETRRRVASEPQEFVVKGQRGVPVVVRR